MTDNVCYQLRQLFEEQQGWQSKLGGACEDNDYQLAKGFLRERQNLYRSYKKEVRALLVQWYGDAAISENIKFEEDGRVVLDCDYLELNDNDFSGQAFPSLIRKINGSLFYAGERFQELDYLEEVQGDLSILHSSVASMKRLVAVDGHFNARSDELKDLSSLERVEGNFHIMGTKLTTIPKLIYVKKNFHGSGASQLESLPELVSCQSLELRRTKISSLPKLAEVEKSCALSGVETLVEIPNLIEVGDFYFSGTSITSLPSLKIVRGVFSPCMLTEHVPKLEEVGWLKLNKSEIKKFPSLRIIKYGCELIWTKIRNFRKAFPQLEVVDQTGGNVIEVTSRRLFRQIQGLQRKGVIKVKGEIVRSNIKMPDGLSNILEGYQ